MGKNKIVQEVLLPASPAEVYDMLADPRKHSEFTGAKAAGTDRLGGKFSTWDGYSFGRNLDLARGKKIVQEWQTTNWPKGAKPSKVILSFYAKGKGTLLKFMQADVPSELLGDLKQGWIDFYWNPLKEYFKKGKR
ncbi:MAG TPA: SRPBCC domain-containing protein [Candidatus Norongarragalinales archaeon]|nr:SRPBCC domain-containing protein [Candidatus Norongarragalinales archaeon]